MEAKLKVSSKRPVIRKYFLRWHDVLNLAGINKLICKGDAIIYYCKVDKLYPLIRTAHSGVANLSREVIRIFTHMCEYFEKGRLCLLK